MTLFAINIVLAFTWALLIADISLGSLASGFLLGSVALWVASPLFPGEAGYFRKGYAVIRLIIYFLYELVLSSVRVAWDVLTPTDLSNPKIVEVPLDVETDAEILLVTNLISLTPGTLSLDVSPDRKTLYVHAMFADDPEGVCRDIKSGMEKLVKEVFE
ncbi:MAG: Na+/H+ antiporter subunit E [Pseudomonadota bacterium]